MEGHYGRHRVTARALPRPAPNTTRLGKAKAEMTDLRPHPQYDAKSLPDALGLAAESARDRGTPYVVSHDTDDRYAVLSFDFHHCHESEYGLTPIVTVFLGATPLPRQIID